ncbi:LiaI-LiaF-like domain-containing protein [Niallia sp. 01092]|uniref:LiaI-LiaF-like domain-containing protein n=1 Tax=unclassified Niallia TaxID=2837522 RepID=UPI003FD42DF5
MKTQKLFSGMILIGFGLYILLKEYPIPSLSSLFVWPTLLLIVGIAFLFQGYWGKDHGSILPGVVLTGFGLHFHLVNKLAIWPDHTGTFLLIIALGFILQQQKSGQGMMNGLLFLLLAIFLLFNQDILKSLGFLKISTNTMNKIIPILFLLLGAYYLLTRKK